MRCRHELPQLLQQRLAAHIKWNESAWGRLVQCVVGLCLPNGLLLGQVWDYDRDLPLVKAEASKVLGAVLQPQEYELEEYVQADGSFKEGQGKIVHRLYLT